MTIHSRPDPVDVTLQKLDVPKSIMNFYKGVEMLADVMHVNDFPFVTTASNNVHYDTITALANLKGLTLEFDLKSAIRSYAMRGFYIIMIIVDVHFSRARRYKTNFNFTQHLIICLSKIYRYNTNSTTN